MTNVNDGHRATYRKRERELNKRLEDGGLDPDWVNSGLQDLINGPQVRDPEHGEVVSWLRQNQVPKLYSFIYGQYERDAKNARTMLSEFQKAMETDIDMAQSYLEFVDWILGTIGGAQDLLDNQGALATELLRRAFRQPPPELLASPPYKLARVPKAVDILTIAWKFITDAEGPMAKARNIIAHAIRFGKYELFNPPPQPSRAIERILREKLEQHTGLQLIGHPHLLHKYYPVVYNYCQPHSCGEGPNEVMDRVVVRVIRFGVMHEGKVLQHALVDLGDS